ncbi:U1 small nuclear ribonucleoprotein, putative [Plasmodium relictum]|uniref:U1 small nuclear ribonucleoprotein, putative n=1 Tax=Plasmodium relictum TaxID=85471 RepID=A0A1J1HAQ4_PLARL|nr:U1 small nuclear ribonucleoprotein, putative [Plasmodium relictum]CRH00687.1 U1 small nuclear ribonucleoprotein, putative [Plasmodium relictum]
MSAIGMPPHILILFQARPLLNYYKPIKKKKPKEYSGLADFLNYFEEGEPPPKIKLENTKERKERKKKEKIMYNELMLKEKRRNYDPFKNEDLTNDPKKTLFIGRLSYEVNEKRLKKEFEIYGKIRKVKIIYDKDNKPRGYAFVEFEHTKSLNQAYNLADGKKIDNRRILVDIERGRTIKNWLPRRLGGGKGPARGSEEKKKITHNINWNALINKDKYKSDKRRNDDRYKNIPLYNERNDDDDDIKHVLKSHKRHRGDDRKSSMRERGHRSKRSSSHDRHHHKHRRKERSRDRERAKERSRDRERNRDRSRSRGRNKEREREKDRDRNREKEREIEKEKDKDKEREKERYIDVESYKENSRNNERENNKLYENIMKNNYYNYNNDIE